jgi:hypothetical protein
MPLRVRFGPRGRRLTVSANVGNRSLRSWACGVIGRPAPLSCRDRESHLQRLSSDLKRSSPQATALSSDRGFPRSSSPRPAAGSNNNNNKTEKPAASPHFDPRKDLLHLHVAVVKKRESLVRPPEAIIAAGRRFYYLAAATA